MPEEDARAVDTIDWDGLTTEAMIGPEASLVRHRLADAARDYRWQDVVEILEPGIPDAFGQKTSLANAVRPGSSSLFAPLHQAAHGGAPTEIVNRLLALGAWRMLANAAGETPIDIARRRGHQHLLAPLRPQILFEAPLEEMGAIQTRFHEVILGRAAEQVVKGQLRLPQLAPALEFEATKWWFAVPGMYGGFSYWLEKENADIRLVSESWSRVVGGSGQRHVVTPKKIELVDEGFV